MHTLTMNSTQDNKDASFLLSQFYKNLIDGNDLNDIALNLKIIDRFLSAGFSINKKFPDNFLLYLQPAGPGYTSALHFLCSSIGNIDFISALLDRGADFTLKNSNNQTVVHQMFEDWLYACGIAGDPYYGDPQCINLLLSAHIKYQNISNPSNQMGFSHFHIACIINHIEAVKFFLQNGVSVDQAVSMDATIFPGYTSLHFATEYANIEIAKILLDYGADIHLEDARGFTPSHILIEHRLSFNPLILYWSKEVKSNEKFENNGKFIRLLLEKDHPLNSSIFTFFAACTIKDTLLVEHILNHRTDINQALSMSSQKWPGYTALHFAADFQDINLVKFLFENGANIIAEDATGVTPLGICFKVFEYEDICSMLLCNSTWRNILMSDGRTNLLELMLSMNSIQEFRSFLRKNPDVVYSVIPANSLFWPGYTLLHLAIAILKSNVNVDDIVTECLDYNLNVNIKNTQGQTPVHLAYRLGKHISVLLHHLQSLHKIRDILDNDNLSYLHIACAQKDEQLVEKLLATSDPNIAYKGRQLNDYIETGSTPLHVAIRNPLESILKMLVNCGADVNITDAYGMTPIHWIIQGTIPWIGNILFSCADLKDCTTEFGLNYLHVAAFIDNKDAVERLVDLGSNIDAVVNYKENCLPKTSLSFLDSFFRFTPLHFAINNSSYKAFIGLVEKGAEIPIDYFKSSEPLQNINTHTYNLFATNVCNGNIENYTERDMGFTRLHAASYEFWIDIVKVILSQGVKVNARIHKNSKIFPECTPLHLLMIKLTRSAFYENLKKIISTIKMFLDKGADVTLADAEGNTPIHLAFKLVDKRGWSFGGADKYVSLLMAGIKDFSINPINGDGISHFHIACFDHNIDAVEEFLQHGVDVNQPTALSSKNYAKCTPLHLAFKFPLTKFSRNQSPSAVVNLLLKNGADVHAQDVQGNTPLHEACRDARANIDILANLIKLGADINKENLRGETPFEILLSSPDVLTDQIKLFIKKGCRLNDSNLWSEKGYIAIFAFSNAAHSQKTKTTLETIKRFSNENTRDEMNRTAIHNAVAVSKSNESMKNTYHELIDYFLKIGIDIDDQDNSGKTALHYAAQFGNDDAVAALLELGIDMNIVDKSGKSAFSYAFERCLKMNQVETYDRFLIQFHLRQLFGLEINQLNKNIFNQIITEHMQWINEWYSRHERKLQQDVVRINRMSVGSNSLILRDFLSDKNVVLTYAFMPKNGRKEIDNFFDSFYDNTKLERYGHISTLFMSQYKIGVTRLHLMEEAIDSLRSLLGFSFPGLCEDILMYLNKAELKNLIISVK